MLVTTVLAPVLAPLATVLAQGAEQTHELPAEPLVFGVGAFVVLVAMVVGVLMFGKGRPHS